MDRQRRHNRSLLALLAVLLLAGSVLSLSLGRYAIPVGEVARILAGKFLTVEKTWQPIAENIVWQVRLPRILAAVLVGAALSVSGAAYQSAFHNPMAAPDLLGASTGAGFGAALAILLGLNSFAVTACAFLGGLACVGLALLAARFSRGDPVLSLILAGMLAGSLFQAGTSYLKLIADPRNTLPEITYWLMGSLSGVRPEELRSLALPLLLGFVPVFLLRWRMNLLSLGEIEGRSLGVNTARLRLALIVCATLLTAASVALCGIVGWVGLIVPHLARRLVGSDGRALLPASFLLGGLFLLLVDDMARSLYTTELPLGILTAVIGAPFFLLLLSRGRGQV